jgi:hypothetical protein
VRLNRTKEGVVASTTKKRPARSVYIDEDIIDEVKKAAEEEHRSINMQIEYILAKWVDEQKSK